jgi:hypothetical protein
VGDPTRPVNQYPDPEIPVDWSVVLQGDAIAFRNAAEAALRKWLWIQAMGREGAGGLIPDDVYHAYEYLAVPARVYYGMAWPNAEDIDARLIPWRRGQ